MFFNIVNLNAHKELSPDLYVQLTKEEVDFIKNTKINVATSVTWSPMNMYNNETKELEGITIDFWNLIKSKLSFNSKITIAEDWNTVLNRIKNKEADITLGTSYDKEKLSYASFSIPYISFPIAFATLYDKRFIPNSSFLENLKVGVGENYSSHIILKKKYPKINFITVKNTKEALKLLSAGEVDVVVDILPVIAHLISINGYYNLKIAGTSKENIDLSFMVRKDYPELIQIINKQISLLNDDEKNKIINELLTVKFDKKFIDKDIIINLSIILIALSILYYFRRKSKIIHNKELEYLSITDSLTGLNNRRKLDLVLNEEIKNKKFSIIILDIDKFKLINDEFGHLEGDDVLKKISNILKNNVNKNDVIGRWGGEEFLIICKNTTSIQAEVLALRLKNLIENNDFKIKKITASFGISEAKRDLNLKDILANADKALYKAKQNGRNQIVNYN